MIKYWVSIQKRPQSIIARLVGDDEYQNIGIRKKIYAELPHLKTLPNMSKALADQRLRFTESFEDHWKKRLDQSQKL